jgi:hypothetical protein
MPVALERSKESRKRVFEIIETYMRTHPDIRIGQLLDNVMYRTKTPLFYIEDNDLAKLIAEAIRDGL